MGHTLWANSEMLIVKTGGIYIYLPLGFQGLNLRVIKSNLKIPIYFSYIICSLLKLNVNGSLSM